jgi:hypothetical protein
LVLAEAGQAGARRVQARVLDLDLALGMAAMLPLAAAEAFQGRAQPQRE